MKISLACANTVPAIGQAMSAAISTGINHFLLFMLSSSQLSMRKRPQAKLFLRDLPQSREPVRLHDQEEDDERAEDHQLELFLQRHRQLEADRVGHVGEEDRHEQDEAGAEERAQHAAQP